MSGSHASTTRSFSSGADGGEPGAILLVTGDGLLTTFSVLGEEATIGRAPECDVAIAHASFSRRHALLRLGPPLTVEDLGSKNGTRIARKRLERGVAAPLSIGESFHIGDFSFVVVRAPRSHPRSTQHGAGALLVTHPTGAGKSSLLGDVARSGLNALIVGETGVGKEVLAETLHRLSRRTGPLVRINCAAIAPSLIESELFGHEKGAFTGAGPARPGLLEAAQAGTVFLDEVGELAPPAQAKLLRAIEAREVVRVGAVKPISLDVRFLAATNRDLSADITAGRFRSDLYFRLDGVTLKIPPLRDRRDQIGPLALDFLKSAAARSPSARPPQLAPDLLAHLEAYDWPGNVRELKAVIERALLLARGGEIRTGHLTLTSSSHPAAQAPDPSPSLSPSEADERQRILSALDQCAGNQTRAAKLLGISRATLVTKLSIYRIPRPRK